MFCTKLSTCTEETAILDGMEIYTWPRKSSPTSQWVEERCGINLDISKQELASVRPSPWGIFPQRWGEKKGCRVTLSPAQRRAAHVEWFFLIILFLKGWALKWKSYTRWIKSYPAVYKMLSNHRHTGLWSVWAARLGSSCLNCGRVTSRTTWLDFCRSVWGLSVTIENLELGSITNKKGWNFESLSVCQAAGFTEPAGARTTAASERWFQISFDNCTRDPAIWKEEPRAHVE